MKKNAKEKKMREHFKIDLSKTEMANKHPTVVFKLDQAIRKWTAESARSNILVG